jgi:hypothetical protein
MKPASTTMLTPGAQRTVFSWQAFQLSTEALKTATDLAGIGPATKPQRRLFGGLERSGYSAFVMEVVAG